MLHLIVFNLSLQFTICKEDGWTVLTLQCFLSWMCLAMFLHVSLTRKRFVTIVTRISVTAMNLHVLFECSVRFECRIAFLTLVFFLKVYILVTQHIIFLCEFFSKWFRRGQRNQMDKSSVVFKTVFWTKLQWAIAASKVSIFVNLFVSWQVCRQGLGLPTLLTDKGSHSYLFISLETHFN